MPRKDLPDKIRVCAECGDPTIQHSSWCSYLTNEAVEADRDDDYCPTCDCDHADSKLIDAADLDPKWDLAALIEPKMQLTGGFTEKEPGYYTADTALFGTPMYVEAMRTTIEAGIHAPHGSLLDHRQQYLCDLWTQTHPNEPAADVEIPGLPGTYYVIVTPAGR